MTQIFNGTEAQIKTQVQVGMLITPSGTEVVTGLQLYPNDEDYIKSIVQKSIAVTPSGTVIQ